MGGSGWFWVILGGSRWFWVVLGDSGSFPCLSLPEHRALPLHF